MKKYTVAITKEDGAKSTYFVLALSAGGAEQVSLKSVYSAKYALASDGWPISVTRPDLFSDAVARKAVALALGGAV